MSYVCIHGNDHQTRRVSVFMFWFYSSYVLRWITRVQAVINMMVWLND
jgi:hypothetical protein